MKTLFASLIALGLLGAVATPASALTVHFGGGHHWHHWGHHNHWHHWHHRHW
jgi:hypothetical protein